MSDNQAKYDALAAKMAKELAVVIDSEIIEVLLKELDFKDSFNIKNYLLKEKNDQTNY